MSVQEQFIGKPFEYTEVIAYQEGSVVSRTLIKTETGTVTVFAFDKDQGLSEHTAPYNALVQIIDGVADITIDGAEHRIAAPSSIIMPANKPHSLKAPEKFKMVLTMIRSPES